VLRENIGFPLKLRSRAPNEIAAKVREMADLMHLKPEYLNRFPRQLSGGEQAARGPGALDDLGAQAAAA
jgi:ABC-type sugar transport system ATPase subunit